MKSFRVRVRSSLLVFIAVVLVGSDLLTYVGLQALLRKYVDSRLLGLGQTLGKLVEQQPDLMLRSEGEFVSRQDNWSFNEGRQELPEVSHSIQSCRRVRRSTNLTRRSEARQGGSHCL